MENNFLELLGINIRKYRLMNCYTQQQLADILYVTKQSISKWEIGKSLPTTENIMYMCPILRCSPNNLLLDSVVLLGYDETKNINYPQKTQFETPNFSTTSYQQPIIPTTTMNVTTNNCTFAQNNVMEKHLDYNYSTSSNCYPQIFGNSQNEMKSFSNSTSYNDNGISTSISNNKNENYTSTPNCTNKKSSNSILSMRNMDNKNTIIIPKFLTKENIQDFFLTKINNKNLTNDELVEIFVNSCFFEISYDFYGLIIYNKFDDITFVYNQSKHKFDKVKNYKKLQLNKEQTLFEKDNVKITQEDELKVIEIDEKYCILITS